MKIIITESQLAKLSEEIHASEAYRELDAILTVLHGKRGIGFDSLGHSKKHLMMLEKNGLRYFRCPSNPGNVIFFHPDHEKGAKELLHIAEKYGGYLAWYATEEDTRRIGELLGYKKEDIEDFIENKWRPANTKI